MSEPKRGKKALDDRVEDLVRSAYVRMLVCLIEGRPVSRTEVLQMLEQVLRQHTHARRRRIDHTVAWLHENPP